MLLSKFAQRICFVLCYVMLCFLFCSVLLCVSLAYFVSFFACSANRSANIVLNFRANENGIPTPEGLPNRKRERERK